MATKYDEHSGVVWFAKRWVSWLTVPYSPGTRTVSVPFRPLFLCSVFGLGCGNETAAPLSVNVFMSDIADTGTIADTSFVGFETKSEQEVSSGEGLDALQLDLFETKESSDTAVATDGDELTTSDVDTVDGVNELEVADPDSFCNSSQDCNDGNPCTDDSCHSEKGCQHESQASTPCTDNNVCTSDDNCSAGFCAGKALNCDDGTTCTNDSCAPLSGCIHTPMAGPCDDGNACTVGDACLGGTCSSSGELSCDDKLVCTEDSCDSAKGCLSKPLPEGAACDDGSPCTIDSVCDGTSFCLLGTDKLWANEVGGDVVTSFVDATLTSDGGFAAVGNEAGQNGNLTHLFRFDSSGTLLWKAQLESWITKLAADSLLGGYWTVTYKAEAGVKKAVAARLNGIGKATWTKELGTDETLALSLYEVDGGIVVVGTRKAASAEYSSPWAVRLDAEGNTLWETTVDMGAPGQFGSGVVTQDGSHIWVGGTSGFSSQICIVRANAKGKLIWKTDLGQDGKNRFAQSVVYSEGDGTVQVGGDGFVLQAGLDGIVQWARSKSLTGIKHLLGVPGLGVMAYGNGKYGTFLDSAGNLSGDFTATANPAPELVAIMRYGDGYIAIGSAIYPNKGMRGWIARTDAWGRTTCIASGVCADIMATACDDASPCTLDSCAGPTQGCVHTVFLDGTPCGKAKSCKAGVCM